MPDFDVDALYAALDEQRRSARADVGAGHRSRDIGGVSAAALIGFAKGGRTGFPDIIRIARWLGRVGTKPTKKIRLRSPR